VARRVDAAQGEWLLDDPESVRRHARMIEIKRVRSERPCRRALIPRFNGAQERQLNRRLGSLWAGAPIAGSGAHAGAQAPTRPQAAQGPIISLK